MDGTVEVDNSPTTFQNALQDRIQEHCRIGIFPFVAVVRKPLANIALTCRAQHCVDQGVQQNVGIAMPIKSKVGVGDVYATDDERSSGDRTMCIVAFADA